MNKEPQIGDIVNVTWADFFPVKALVISEKCSLDLYEIIFLEGAIKRSKPDIVWASVEALQNMHERSSIYYLTVVSELSDEE